MIRSLLTIISTASSRRPRYDIDCIVHLPLSQHPMSGAPLIHQQQGAAAICGWDIVFVNILLAGFILPRQFYSSDLSLLHPSHQPPIILSTILRCSNHIARRCSGTKVRNGLQYYLQMLANSPANFLLPASPLLQSMQQYMAHDNQRLVLY
jgi:hypothetical protein